MYPEKLCEIPFDSEVTVEFVIASLLPVLATSLTEVPSLKSQVRVLFIVIPIVSEFEEVRPSAYVPLRFVERLSPRELPKPRDSLLLPDIEYPRLVLVL